MNLVLAVLLLFFSFGRWVIPIAVWLSPLFLLRFVRGGRALPRLAMAGLALYAIGCVTWWGMVPVPAPLYFLVMLGVMLPGVLPYLADRMLVRRGDGFLSTLVFPAAWVVTEFFNTHLSPYGSWGAVAYTQVDFLLLMQSAAMMGLWGVAFLVAWTASVANWALENGFQWTRVRRGVLIWAGTLGAVVLMGGGRMIFAAPDGPTIRVAGFAIPTPPTLSPDRLLSQPATGADLDDLRAALHEHEDSLFARVRLEALAGARLVAWSEVGAYVLKDDEQAFEERAASVARESGVHLVTGVAVFAPGEGFYENLLIAFDSTGTRIARYHKARPVPGDPERGKDDAIPVATTALGRMAGAVCFDADFPDLIRRAGRESADLLVIPASDWREIDPLHTRMALVRGIENGCSVVRVTHKGLSAAADRQGRILAATDFFRSTPAVMVAQVPVGGRRTLYPRVPDLLPCLCVGVLGIAAVLRPMFRSTAAETR